MHLKPYPKLQKKDASLESSQEPLRRLQSSHHTTVGVERCQSTCKKPLCCKSIALVSHISLWCPRPYGFISQNKMCNMRNPADNVSFKGRKKHMSENILPPSIHQEEGEAQLDIWAVIKPGNTKEKIAFFAAHQCSNRTNSLKIKSSWDAEVTTAKRRRKSVDLDKIKIHPTRKDSVKDIDRKYLRADPPITSNYEENSLINIDKQNGDGLCHSSSLSVAEMVALLEQRANSLLPDCSKTFTNANSSSFALSKGGSPSVEAISDTGSESGLNHKKSTENKLQGEYVRVIEVIAKLESECLKNQHNRNGEARNNSFRRGVERVLLTNPHLTEESTKSTRIIRKTTGLSSTVDNIGQSKEQCSHLSTSYNKPCTEPQDNATNVPSPSLAINFSGVVLDLSTKEASLTLKEVISLPNSTRELCSNDAELSVASCNPPSLCWEMENKFVSNFTLSENGMGEYANNFIVNELESCVVDRNMVRKVKEATECTSVTKFNPCEEPLPGELFFTLEQSHMENLDSNENTTEEILNIAQYRDHFISESRTFNTGCLEVNPSDSLTPFGMMCPLTEPFPLRRQVSHEFLETRFKIQQLLEPRQYMAFLPHHIMVKIFMFLPTKTLAALKCTCHYFKFIIENYDIRATDSRWVCDPRYKDDPCKQCKKHYSKGDVSPCRWHSKPYYKVLPYGRSYWMCCWQSEKDSPGCKIGLHDNNWVQSHKHNQQICEKV
ncbi:F-box only protein 34 [Narcine bancroftii]|uniref:F-box only protein 34 n=1 Tax=Narcine bancroftii TaxID=1343680 RepID=UPI003831ADEA